MSELKHRFITTNGIQMHIAEQGEGPLVVLCHGFPESWYSWQSTTSGPSPCSAMCIWIPLVVMKRCLSSGIAAAPQAQWRGNESLHGHELLVARTPAPSFGGRRTIIDLPQAVDPRQNSQAELLLERDLANVVRYFARYKVEEMDPRRMAHNLFELWRHGDL